MSATGCFPATVSTVLCFGLHLEHAHSTSITVQGVPVVCMGLSRPIALLTAVALLWSSQG